MVKPPPGVASKSLASAGGAVALYAAMHWLAPTPETWTTMGAGARVIELGLLVGVGVAVYFVAIAALGVRARDFGHRV